VIKRNAVGGRRFSQMLAEAFNRYQNRIIDAAQVIAEIVELTESPTRSLGTAASFRDRTKTFSDRAATSYG
jgi:Type I restriction enzyme HindI endonuclease subunit-like, C-terminal